MTSPDPVLRTARVAKLRPTQMTVGYREVELKRADWREQHGEDCGRFLGRHMIPCVVGPKGRYFVLDHHHLARALWDEGVEEVAVTVVADLSALKREEFWLFLDNRGWCHPYDAHGRRQALRSVPKRISDLGDDPFRSLAGEVRRSGGFAKDLTPFAEFLWADFFRRRVDHRLMAEDWPKAVSAALELAHSPRSTHLPGWAGPKA